MKYFILAIILFSYFQVKSCPACNIHNHLDGSIQASKNIYKGKVLEEEEDGVFSVEVIEIYRMDGENPFSVGDIKSEYLYPSMREGAGSEFIFADPRKVRVTFRILDVRLEDEVKYLVDTARTITSGPQAVRLLEGVSWSSYQEAREYIEDHYSECYDLLASRVVELRKSCQAKEESFYNKHRLTNLLSGLFVKFDDRAKNLVLSELTEIMKSDLGPMSIDSISYAKTPIIGEYLRKILQLTKDEDFGDILVDKYVDYVNSDSTSTLTFFTYALAFRDVSLLDKIEVNNSNKRYVVLGVVSAALWNKRYWQRSEVPPLLKKIEELTPSSQVQEFVEVNFKEYVKEEVEEDDKSNDKKSKRERRRDRKSSKSR